MAPPSSTACRSAVATSLMLMLVSNPNPASATGPFTPADQSLSYLLSKISSSQVNVHRDGDLGPDPEFECAWRNLALKYATTAQVQPNLSPAHQQLLSDALELDTLCKQHFEPEITAISQYTKGTDRSRRSGQSVIYADAEHGSDTSGDGSLTKPFASLPVALDATRKLRKQNDSPGDVAIELLPGTYRLSEALELTEEDSGLTITSYNLTNKAEVSGATLLHSKGSEGNAIQLSWRACMYGYCWLLAMDFRMMMIMMMLLLLLMMMMMMMMMIMTIMVVVVRYS